MRVAVVGSGIAGLGAAWLLSRRHDVVLYEADARLGGHTHTHDVELFGQRYRVDTGFIVHNRENYPLLTRMFDELGVATRETTMSFSVSDARSGLEYAATSLDALFCQRRNLLSPRFLGLLADLVRFYRNAPSVLAGDGPGPTLGEFLARGRYGDAFRDAHLVPMAAALWSAPHRQVLEFPARHLVAFMANHRMLTLGARPAWRTVVGGSRAYVDALVRQWPVSVRLATAVRRVARHGDGVEIVTAASREHFDHAVLACHSDQALAVLADADATERELLGAIAYQPNDVVLHTDSRVLPAHRKAWAAWNAHVPADPDAPCTVSYSMSILQGIAAPEPLIVTLNRSADIDPDRVLARARYMHPVFDTAAIAAQARRADIQGHRRTWFAGAYWGWGFHEDGLRSAVEVAAALGVPWDASIAASSVRGHAEKAMAT